MSALFLERARTILFLSFYPITFSLRMISMMVVFTLWPLPYLEKLQKFFLWRGLPDIIFLCLFMLLLVLYFLSQPLQINIWPLCS